MATTSAHPQVKVFIHSSVLIAAAISPRGSGRELLNAGIMGRYHLLCSDLVLAESARNISRKAPAAAANFRMFEEAFAIAIVNPTKERVLEVDEIVELKDAPIVAGAIEAGTKYLATYDQQHLLKASKRIRDAFGIDVATPAEILRIENK